MAFSVEHALHKRRFGRNLGVALTLAAFAAVLFGLTLAKISSGSMMEAYDHTPRASMLPRDSAQ